VRTIARRYSGRGETPDDLVQAGAIGLIRATDRFDPRRGVAFATFATPAIEGEIRRHLDDRTASLRIPRELQRMSGELRRCRTQLSASLGRTPTVNELANALVVKQEDSERVLTAERAREVVPVSPDDAGEETDGTESVSSADERLLLERSARVLDERERRIVFLRFHADMTEREIAKEVGISQAQVSRVLTGALAKLRQELDDPGLGPGRGDSSENRVISRRKPVQEARPGSAKPGNARSHAEPATRIADVSASPGKADLALPYHVTVRPEGGGAGSGWTAALEELPGCEARAATPEEAVERLRSAMENWLAVALEGRRQIRLPKPEPSKRRTASSHSGRFLVRMPSDLHEELTRAPSAST
jgi:RNA polymerase sigma-B factor